VDFQKNVPSNKKKRRQKKNSKITFISASYNTIRAAKAERPSNVRKYYKPSPDVVFALQIYCFYPAVAEDVAFGFL
jgi:hypothetical protein